MSNSWLDSIFTSTNQTVDGKTVQINTAQVIDFRTLLNSNAQPLIRLFVGTGGSYGNQAASVNLLRRLTDPITANNLTYDYAGTVEVYYDGGQGTLDKLYELLPELNDNPNGHVNQATVSLLAYDPQNPPGALASFGFTGAVDSSNTNYATPLNVSYFIQLQPYNYNYAEKVFFLDDAHAPVDLRAVPELNSPSFARRVSYIPPSTYTPPNWGAYAGNMNATILQYLTSDAVLKEVRLVVSYAIMPANANVINSSPEAAAAILCGSMLAWQEDGSYRSAAPVVVLNLNRFGDPNSTVPIDGIRALLEGGPTRNEAVRLASKNPQNVAQAQQVRQVWDARRKYMLGLNAATRYTALNYPQTLQAVQTAVTAITSQRNRVLFIQLGPVPQPLFYYALSRTNMISLFEGANSTMAAINMGQPFLALPRRGAGVVPDLYPNVNRGFFSASPPIDALANAANQLNFDLDSWPTGWFSTDPCSALAAFLTTLTEESSVTDPIARYFHEIKDYYATSAADKVNVAFAYLLYLYERDHPNQDIALAKRPATAALVAIAGARDGETNPLNALYADLQKKVEIGKKLDLIPGVLAKGNIPDVILGVLQGQSLSLWLTVEHFDHEGEPGNITEISLGGTTGVLQGLNVTNAITVIFDAPDGTLRSGVELGSTGTWSISGVPWIQMSAPFVRVQVSDAPIPVVATLGGSYDALGARLQVLVPVVKDQWLVTAAFDKPLPSIDRAFQMAASVNLVQVLPAPLNTLADLGLAQVDLYYDSAGTDVPAIGFILKSNSDQPLPLVGKISLSDIEAQVAIVNPKTKLEARASANGTFTIGTGPDAGVVVVGVQYPSFIFNGGLASGKIELRDLLSLFLPEASLELLSLPHIDQFDFNYTQATSNLSVSMKLVFDQPWTFDFFGRPLFALDDVGFSIARSKGQNIGAITATTTLFPGLTNALVLGIGAFYLGGGTWRFSIEQQKGTVFSINELLKTYLGASWATDLPFPDVSDLLLRLDWGDKQATSFEFAAATAKPWTPIPVLPDVTVTGKLELGHDEKGTNGTLGADLTLWNIKLQVSYNFDPTVQKLVVRWLSFVATLEQNADKQTIATFSLDGQSVGSLVETFVSWATGAAFGLSAPWNVLNSITLNGLKLVYNFSLEQVSFTIDIGPIDFGLFKIKGLSLKYDPKNKDQPVEITIDGSFVWQSGDKISWDPSKPETTPAPPGGGNKYLDLRLAALGQHVTVPGLTEQRDVQGVIELLRDLQVPNPPDIPVGGNGQPVFAPNNSWFVAFDFGVLKVEEKKPSVPPLAVRNQRAQSLTSSARERVLAADPPAKPVYFIQLSIVFNDPTLYALRVALDGPMAKIFAGLDFQIMYRQVSDTVGCYSAKIALPNLMRKFQIGVATITLPDFGIDVYTNGDFQVDLGFPWNQDFSRSFTIELIIPPGIPVLGSAGFYFGKLSSATTDKVPVRSTGWFNPVLVFGFGAQIGLGKSIEAGILSAGFSITVFGIIEGVIARWLPYNEPTTDTDKLALQEGYYFSITGTMGIQGRLYGSIDFAIIKASVDVAIKIFARITFASYEDIPIMASAMVSARVSVSINLGLFKISISFSFSMSVEATFVLTNPMQGPPPWGYALSSADTKATSNRHALGAGRHSNAAAELHQRRLQRARSVSPRRGALVLGAGTFNWDNLLPGKRLLLQGWTAPVLTVAGDAATSAAEQAVCYVANFFLATPTPLETVSPEVSAQNAATEHARIAHAALARAQRRATALATAASGDDPGATFEDLVVRVLQWAIAAGQTSAYTPDQVDDLVVGDAFLADLVQYLSGVTTPTPITADAAEVFLGRQTAICFAQTDARASANGVFFPAPPGITLKVDDYGAWKGFDYTFGSYNTTDSGYLDRLNAYFKALQVQVAAESPHESSRAKKGATAPNEHEPSVASYVFGDYFTSLASQAIQALRDGLGNFKLVIDDSLTLQGIADWINKTGQLTGDAAVTCAQLFVANRDHALSTSASGPLVVPEMTWSVTSGQSFASIAEQTLFGGGFTGKSLALTNAQDARILAPNQTIALGANSHLTQTGDSLQSIASAFEISVDALCDRTDVLTSTTLLRSLAALETPSFGHLVAVGDTPARVAAKYGVSLDGIASASANVSHLFERNADPNLNVPLLPQFQVGALIDELRRTLALQNLGAMMSRYYLHGLRLPTAGLTANARGLFVTGGPGNYQYPAELGLFALTGQAFPLPDIVDPNGGGDPPIFQYTMTRSASEGWLSLGTTGSAAVTFELKDAGDYSRYSHVAATAHAGPLSTGTSSIEPSSVAEEQAARFPLSGELTWQTPAPVLLPHQVVTPTTPQPRLWNLPSAMINTPLANDVLPRFQPVLARTDQASGSTVDVPVENYGFGTLIAFGVRRSKPVAGSPSSARLYEIIGASDRDIVLLERLIGELSTSADAANGSFQQMQILFQPASTSSDVKGWQMNAPEATLAGISQVNLSTDTKPPSSQSSRRTLGAVALPTNIVNTPLEFLRLLWEASITRQGGFYLAYSTGIGGSAIQGLPESAFNDRGEAQVAVLSLFVGDAQPGQRVADYMNVAATNEALDLSDAALVARAVITDAQTRPLERNATLAAIAAAHYTRVDLLVARNASAPLAADASLQVNGGLYEVGPAPAQPGGQLQAIADYFLTTVNAIKQANPHRTTWPDPLPVFTSIALPAVTVEAGTTLANGARFTSFADIAQYFAAPLAALAAANAERTGLFPEAATLSVQLGPTELSSITQPGVTGVDLTRSAPPAIPDRPDDADWGRIYLLNFFNLLGYRISDTPDFGQSNWGLSCGPADPDDRQTSLSHDKIRAPRPQAAAGAPWLYSRSVPYSSFSKFKQTPQVLPAATVSPYWGVGGLLQLELMWLDLFGNKILSDLDLPSAAPSGASPILNFPPQLTGYTDRLFAIGQWPGVANAFRIASVDDTPAIVVSLAFDQSAYTDAPAEKIAQAIAIYAQILLQLHDPNGVDIGVTTSVTPSATSVLMPAQTQALVEWAAGIYAWLCTLGGSATATHRTLVAAFKPELDLSAPLDAAQLNDSQIFLVTASLTFTRQARLVSGELDGVPGVRSASTALAPSTGSLTRGTEAQRDLSAFGADFSAAFAGISTKSYRIAAGSTRNAFTSADARNVWAVQLGIATDEAISYRVKNPGAPIQFAPRPVSNQLVSRANTPIITYKTGTVIGPKDPSYNRAFTSIDLDQWMSSALVRIDELLTPKYVAPAQILRSKSGVDNMRAVLDAKQNLANALKTAMIGVFADESPTGSQLVAIQEVFYQRMLSALGDFYTVRAGLQFQAQVTSAIRPLSVDQAPPRLYGEIVLDASNGADPSGGSLSLTSPKLALDLAGGPANAEHDMSFLLSSAQLDVRKVTLALTFKGQAIEHEIGNLTGVDGYQPSSWVNFADSSNSANWPLTQSLGTFDTPIVLRAFPQTPMLLSAEAASDLNCPCYVPPLATARPSPSLAKSTVPCPKPGTFDPLSNITRWSYRFRYSMQAHNPRDALHGTITFNVEDTRAGLQATPAVPPRDVFDNLAEFVEVYPAILQDLDAFLVPIDTSTTDPSVLANANAALLSAAQLIQWIADTAGTPLTSPSPKFGLGKVAPFTFLLTQDGVLKTSPGGEVTALRVTLKNVGELPGGLGAPFVEVAPETYECEPDAISADSRSFVYKDRKTGDYLTVEKGLSIPTRGVVLPDMNILECQDVGTSVYLTRNEELVDGRRSASPFIYQTPTVEYPSPLLPTIDDSTPVNLATIGAVGPEQPVNRSLSCQLGVLYETLFTNAGTTSVTLSVTVYYEYSINPSLPRVRLPVFLQPPTEVALEKIADVIASQVKGCEAWFAANNPNITSASLLLDLTIMSNLTARPMPSLRLRALFVDLANISPPLGS